MRLCEFDGSTGEDARVKRLKDTAKNARDKAKQLRAQATASAQQLKAKQAKIQAHAASTPVPQMPGKPGWDR